MCSTLSRSAIMSASQPGPSVQNGNAYSALLRHRLEVVGPCAEGACERETVEAQHRLVVLDLAEIEYFAHELRQNPCVALHHLHQRTVARRE